MQGTFSNRTGSLWRVGLAASGIAISGLVAQEDPAPAPAAGRTAGELLGDARAAFEAADFEAADALFTEFVETYRDEPQVAAAIEEIKVLRALAKLRLKKFAAALPLVDASLADPDTPPEVVDQLAFWRGLCLMQGAGYRAAQVAFGEFYRDRKTRPEQRSRCHEALLLFAACDTLAGRHADAADFLSWQMPRLRRESAEAAARATVMLLYSLLEGGRLDAALSFVLEQYGDIASVTQLVSFQSLTLELGSRFLDAGEYHKAIACLQRVWKRDRLLEHQRERLADLEAKLEILRARGLEDFVFQYDGMRRRVASELEGFVGVADFDAALRLRLASAFQGLGRYREAALVLEDMLETMEPSETVAGATVTLIQCWMEVGRWPRAVAAADTFVERLGEGAGAAQLPVVSFLKGRALHSAGENVQALEVFRDVYRRFPDSPVAGNALFMQGIVLLALERNDEGIALFRDMRRELPGHPLGDDAFYWQGMGHSFAGDHTLAREHLGEYLEAYPEGRYRPDAAFRRAFSLFSLADYSASNAELTAYLEAYPGDAYNDEARLLLGDGLLATGALDEGVASYRAIAPSSTRFFEDGWFKVGKALKLQKRYPEMREHFTGFVDAHPSSRRMAEAVYWVGWTHGAEGHAERARQIYWETIGAQGDRPALFGVADLFDGLRKLYGVEGRPAYRSRLAELARRAQGEGLPTLELHAQWAAAEAWPEGSAEARLAAGRACELVDPELHNPRIVADCADGLYDRGELEQADALYAELRKWHPRAPERDRAFLGRARIAQRLGRPDEALALLARFAEETPFSLRVAEGKLLESEVLAARGQHEAGLAVLADLLADRSLSSGSKAEALFRSAELLAASGEDLKATAYFERVYVAYGKYRGLVAQSYLRRGELLDKLGRAGDAAEVYRELVGREELKGMAEVVEARRRLDEMGEGGDA